MGMFTQKPEEKATWAALPGESLDRDEADLLAAQPATDPFALGLGGLTGASAAVPVPADAAGSGSVTSVSIVLSAVTDDEAIGDSAAEKGSDQSV